MPQPSKVDVNISEEIRSNFQDYCYFIKGDLINLNKDTKFITCEGYYGVDSHRNLLTEAVRLNKGLCNFERIVQIILCVVIFGFIIVESVISVINPEIYKILIPFMIFQLLMMFVVLHLEFYSTIKYGWYSQSEINNDLEELHEMIIDYLHRSIPDLNNLKENMTKLQFIRSMTS